MRKLLHPHGSFSIEDRGISAADRHAEPIAQINQKKRVFI